MIDAVRAGRGSCLGLEIGGTKLQLCVGQGPSILERHVLQVDAVAGGAGIRGQLEKIVPDLARRVRPAAVGVGFGGPVDWRTGRICCSHQIEGWSDFPLTAWLSDLAGAPARADNDADVAALGEALHGAGRDFQLVFYVTLGSGVGGGMVSGGAIFHGATPGEAEVGHLRLDRAGTTVEIRCSGWAVDARLRAAALKNAHGILARCLAGATPHEAKFLAVALTAGDPDASLILKETADDLAFGLSHVTHLFHPEIIILGGGLALAGEPLRAAVQSALAKYIMRAFAPGPKVALSQLREDAVLVGALSLVQAAKTGT